MSKTEEPDLSNVKVPASATCASRPGSRWDDEYRRGVTSTAVGLMGLTAGLKISQAAGWASEDASTTDRVLMLGTCVATTVGGSLLGTWIAKKVDVLTGIIGKDCQ